MRADGEPSDVRSATSVESKYKLGPDSAGILMTPEEFDEISDYDDLYRYELVHEVLVVSPFACETEVAPNEVLAHALLSYRESHPEGGALDRTLPDRYVLTRDSRRRADRVIWAGLGRRPNPKQDVPTIVVEFASRAKADRRRDYEEKRREYLEIGVAEYWIIDRFRRHMTVFRSQPGQPPEQVVGEKHTYRTDLLPGFELPLARLLAAADAWKE